MVVTITTVGYGDVNSRYKNVDSTSDKIFTSFFVLVGVGLIGNALGVLLASVLDREDALAARLARDPENRRSSASSQQPRKGLTEAQSQLLVSMVSVGGVIAFGTVGFGVELWARAEANRSFE